MATLEDLDARMTVMEGRMRSRPDVDCTAQSPHPNDLVFMRGPNRYMCGRCGKAYVKGTGGTLRDE